MLPVGVGDRLQAKGLLMSRAKGRRVMVQSVDLFNMPDGTNGRGPGVYMDHEQRIAAEVRRAKLEGREPDLDNPPATVGTALSEERWLPGPTEQATVPVELQPGKADPVTAVPRPEDTGPTVDVSLANQYAAESAQASAIEAVNDENTETVGPKDNLEGQTAPEERPNPLADFKDPYAKGEVSAETANNNESGSNLDPSAEGATDPNDTNDPNQGSLLP